MSLWPIIDRFHKFLNRGFPWFTRIFFKTVCWIIYMFNTSSNQHDKWSNYAPADSNDEGDWFSYHHLYIPIKTLRVLKNTSFNTDIKRLYRFVNKDFNKIMNVILLYLNQFVFEFKNCISITKVIFLYYLSQITKTLRIQTQSTSV